jgi:PEGA domain
MTKHLYSRSLISVAALAMVIGAGSPALAQQHRGGDHNRRATADNRHAPPAAPSRQVVAPRVVASNPSYLSRGYRSVSPVVVVGRAAPRIFRGPIGVGPRVSVRVAPARFYRPYYSFQPRLRISTGFFIGFPVAYSYGYYYDPYYSAYGYPYPAYPAYSYPAPTYPYPQYPPQAYPQSAYPSPAPGSVAVQPGQVGTGGASFEITPDTASVFVDGISMGAVGQFTPMTEPLGLAPGHHHFEVRAPGYRTIAFDADIVAGQVTPFQGTMER